MMENLFDEVIYRILNTLLKNPSAWVPAWASLLQLHFYRTWAPWTVVCGGDRCIWRIYDPELEPSDGPLLSTKGSYEFKPFIRRLPDFKFCYTGGCLKEGCSGCNLSQLNL